MISFRYIIFILVTALPLSCSRTELSRDLLQQYLRAKSSYIRGDVDEALEQFILIEQKVPHFSANSFMIGKIYFFKEDYRKAESTWSEALRYNTHHTDSAKWLSRLHLLEAQPDRAEDLITCALQNNSEDPELLILMGKIKWAQENFSQAIEFYKKAQLFEEKLAEARIDLAEIYRDFGLIDRTVPELERALQLLDQESPIYHSVHSILSGLKEVDQ
ncbi:hypothetical protein ES703_66691 [subsurface metagenome]